MLFQSQFYVLVFLPAVVLLYYAVAGSVRGRQWVLIGASLIFYGWWDVRFVVLPISQIAASVILLILTVMFTMWLAGRLFRVSTLLSGQTPRLSTVLQLVRHPGQ